MRDSHIYRIPIADERRALRDWIRRRRRRRLRRASTSGGIVRTAFSLTLTATIAVNVGQGGRTRRCPTLTRGRTILLRCPPCTSASATARPSSDARAHGRRVKRGSGGAGAGGGAAGRPPSPRGRGPRRARRGSSSASARTAADATPQSQPGMSPLRSRWSSAAVRRRTPASPPPVRRRDRTPPGSPASAGRRRARRRHVAAALEPQRDLPVAARRGSARVVRPAAVAPSRRSRSTTRPPPCQAVTWSQVASSRGRGRIEADGHRRRRSA